METNTMSLLEQLKTFNAKDEQDLFAVKTAPNIKQRRVFSTEKPGKVEMTADKCKAACESIGIEYLSGYEGRVLKYVTTNEAQDRYGDIVRAKGAELKNYKNNPVVQFAHDYQSPPVGNSIRIWKDNELKAVMAEALYMDNRVDSSGRADTIFKMCASGFMKACSIGFMPIESKRPANDDERKKTGLGQYGIEFIKWDYLEFSPVPVPANPEALQNYFKEIKDAKLYTPDDFKALESLKMFDANMTDMFIELARGNTGKIFKEINFDSAFDSILKAPVIKEETPEPTPEPKPEPTPEPEKPEEPKSVINVHVHLELKDIVTAINEINETSKAMKELFAELRKSYPEHGGQAEAGTKDDLYKASGDTLDDLKNLNPKI